MNEKTRNKHIWEGWTVGHFIDELEPMLDRIQSGKSWQKPLKTKEELVKWLKDRQPYYKKTIPEVVKYFSNKYWIK
jgi:hypothetical protein